MSEVLFYHNMTVYIPESVTHLCFKYPLGLQEELSKLYVIEGSEAEKFLKEINEEKGYQFNYEVI